jgi:hypothetical protein
MQLDVGSSLESKVVKVVSDPAVATRGTVNGKLIPLLILDTTERPDLVEVVRVHRSFEAGDVRVQWGALEGRLDHVVLFLRFLRPTERTAIIEFEIEKQGALVDQILTAGAMYLQPGKPGDRLLADLSVQKMIVEIPDTGFRDYWDKLYLKSVVKSLRRSGMSRTDAKRAALAFIYDMRQLGRFQMP